MTQQQNYPMDQQRYPVNSGPPAYPNAMQPVIVMQPANSNGMGTAGFVTGLIGLIFCWVPVLGIILAALGIIFGGVASSASRKAGTNNSLAIAGLVLGVIALVIAILLIIAVSSTP